MQNYAQQLAATLNKIEKQISLGAKKPSLLLHACCAPCSSYVLEYLKCFFEITVYYYNPNIHPQAEYTRRLEELKKFLPAFQNAQSIQQLKLVEAAYIPQEFFDATNAARDGLENEAERGERCRRCYKLRMERSYEFAIKNKFDWFTTTLSISPHKDAQKINEIGFELEAAASNNSGHSAPNSFSNQDLLEPHTKYLCADFKKQNGFKRSLELSKEYGLYRQDYCGCIYSITRGSLISF